MSRKKAKEKENEDGDDKVHLLICLKQKLLFQIQLIVKGIYNHAFKCSLTIFDDFKKSKEREKNKIHELKTFACFFTSHSFLSPSSSLSSSNYISNGMKKSNIFFSFFNLQLLKFTKKNKKLFFLNIQG